MFPHSLLFKFPVSSNFPIYVFKFPVSSRFLIHYCSNSLRFRISTFILCLEKSTSASSLGSESILLFSVSFHFVSIYIYIYIHIWSRVPCSYFPPPMVWSPPHPLPLSSTSSSTTTATTTTTTFSLLLVRITSSIFQ